MLAELVLIFALQISQAYSVVVIMGTLLDISICIAAGLVVPLTLLMCRILEILWKRKSLLLGCISCAYSVCYSDLCQLRICSLWKINWTWTECCRHLLSFSVVFGLQENEA